MHRNTPADRLASAAVVTWGTALIAASAAIHYPTPRRYLAWAVGAAVSVTIGYLAAQRRQEDVDAQDACEVIPIHQHRAQLALVAGESFAAGVHQANRILGEQYHGYRSAEVIDIRR